MKSYRLKLKLMMFLKWNQDNLLSLYNKITNSHKNTSYLSNFSIEPEPLDQAH